MFSSVAPYTAYGLRDMFIFSFQVCVFILKMLLAYSLIFIYFLGTLLLQARHLVISRMHIVGEPHLTVQSPSKDSPTP
jgi:hypothetical protein